MVLDLCQYDPSFDVSTLWSAHGPVTLDRWVIDPAAGKVARQRLDDRWQEFPRVGDRVVPRARRYGYSAVIGQVARAFTAGDIADSAFANAILKHDLDHGTVQAHEFGRDATAGEAVFAPASPDATRDDGYVLAFARNPERGAADLVIHAAQDFTAEPVARIHLPARIPLGFHGSWIPDHQVRGAPPGFKRAIFLSAVEARRISRGGRPIVAGVMRHGLFRLSSACSIAACQHRPVQARLAR